MIPMSTIFGGGGARSGVVVPHRGLFVGQPSGAYLKGALEVAKESNAARIVMILCDIGERYFSAGLWNRR